jgi:hypothetical protein
MSKFAVGTLWQVMVPLHAYRETADPDGTWRRGERIYVSDHAVLTIVSEPLTGSGDGYDYQCITGNGIFYISETELTLYTSPIEKYLEGDT